MVPAAPANVKSCRFYFIDAARLRAYAGRTLPHFQHLLVSQPGMLVPREVSFVEACKGSLVGTVCTVSHRWMGEVEPDADGTQLEAIKEYLEAHKAIEWLWYDAWCLPQGRDKTPDEKAEFDKMLREVNMLYLGTSVHVLLDLSYLSRFWTQYEAWLGMQTPTVSGLRPATEAERRCTITPIYNATDELGAELEKMWARRTPEEAVEVLAKPDVTVTNSSDKVIQLGKLARLNQRVREDAEVRAELDS